MKAVYDCRLIIILKGVLVEEVFAQAGSTTLQLGNVITQLLDSLGLLGQEVGLDEVAHLEYQRMGEMTSRCYVNNVMYDVGYVIERIQARYLN